MFRFPRPLLVLTLSCVFGGSPATAEPFVIYDSGDTVPMPAPWQPVDVPFAASTQSPPMPTGFEGLPVRSPALSPGLVAARRIDKPFLSQPFFIVGADPRSLAWLSQNRAALQQHGAVGLAVNVDTRQQLERLRQASGLPVHAVSGDKIARQLGLSHYPALVSKTLIEQ